MNAKTTTRPNRSPTRSKINGKRSILNVTGADPSKVQRIVNDVGDRVSQFEAEGWTIVTDPSIKVGDRRIANPTKEGSPVRVSVGGGQQAYVMQIPKDIYEDIQKEKAEFVDETESGMKREASKAADYGKLSVSQ